MHDHTDKGWYFDCDQCQKEWQELMDKQANKEKIRKQNEEWEAGLL